MEEKFEAKVFWTHQRCDDCDNGYMKPTGTVLTTYPPIYPHRCDRCGAVKSFSVSYPYMTYEHDPDVRSKLNTSVSTSNSTSTRGL